MKLRRIIPIIATLACTTSLYGQFYNTGATPDSVVWRQISTPTLRMIYPEYFGYQTRRTLYYMDSVQKSIDWGLDYGVMRVPVVMKTQSFASNGLSMWAPKRIEIVGIPPSSTYSTPWLKQLSVHEYRHSAQYTALNRNTVKALSYLFGEQILLLTSGLMPFWWIEGDATDAETQASLYGRGLQPSFTLHYRAAADRILSKRNPDRWFCGSYKEYIPSHYELGYQLVSYANTVNGRYAWREVVEYGSKYPFLIFTTEIAERKYLKTSTRRLFRDTFTDLGNYWASLPEQSDSAERIPTHETSYTVYAYPQFLNDTTIIALKSDFDRTARFVEVDTRTASERTLCMVGSVESQPTLVGRTLYWTEYSQNTLWEQQINSLLYSFNLDTKARKLYAELSQTMFPIGDAYVWYDLTGRYEIVYYSNHYLVEEGISVHGLAQTNGLLYYIALGDNGMSIEELDPTTGATRTIKQAAHVTLSALRAQEGKLYFGTIVSGKDEVAVIDLADGSEELLSQSHYGAFQPSPSPDGERVVMTVYDRNGYHLAVDSVRSFGKVGYTPLPRNLVNPPRLKWDVRNVDSLRFTPREEQSSERKHPSAPYKKGQHLFDFHSWAPIYYRPDQLMSGYLGTLAVGATIVSQNLLSSAETTIGYGYTLEGTHLAELNLKYYGLPVKFEFNALWKSTADSYTKLYADDNLHYWQLTDNYYSVATASGAQPAPSHHGGHISLYGRGYLPLVLEHSYRTRTLVPTLEYRFVDTPLYNPSTKSYTTGGHIVAAAVQYTDNQRRATRDILPRWGYAVRLSAGRRVGIEAPASWSVYGRAYLPGFALHHSLKLVLGTSSTVGTGPLAYSLDVSGFSPRGVTSGSMPVDNRFGSIEYQLPLCYPDAGISGIVFLKRIRLAAFAEGELFAVPKIENKLYSGQKSNNLLYSYGGELYFDCSFLRLPAEGDTTIMLSLYMPSDKQKPVFSGGFSVNF